MERTYGEKNIIFLGLLIAQNRLKNVTLSILQI